jgi:hypothetical protein
MEQSGPVMQPEFVKDNNPDVNSYGKNPKDTNKYRKYITEPFWKQWHKIHGQDTERYCACCIRKEQTMDVHHLTYVNAPYQERYEDLVQLCKDCHQLVHQYYNQWHYYTHPPACNDRFDNISLADATTDFINLVHDCYNNDFNLTDYQDKDKHNIMRIRNMFESVKKRKIEGRIKHKEWILTQWSWCNKFIEQNAEWRNQVNTRTPLEAEQLDNDKSNFENSVADRRRRKREVKQALYKKDNPKHIYYHKNKKKPNKYEGMPKELSGSGKGLGDISDNWKWRAEKIARANGDII